MATRYSLFRSRRGDDDDSTDEQTPDFLIWDQADVGWQGPAGTPSLSANSPLSAYQSLISPDTARYTFDERVQTVGGAQKDFDAHESAAANTKDGAAASVGRLLNSTPPDDVGVQVIESSSLIRLTNMRADPRFAGVDGSGYSVVIIDTGADLDHAAFGPDANGNGVADRIVFQFDFSGANDGNANDTKGHGTHVAGTIGSQNPAYVGIAPGANLIILKVFPDNVDGASSVDIEEAARWVVNNAAAYNIVSVNLSLGGGNFNSAQTTYLHDEFQSWVNLGIAPVVATGNSFFSLGSAPGVGQPAADSLAWGVGAVYDANIGSVSFQSGAMDFTTAPDRITSFTQRTTVPGLLDIFAPGGAITNAYLGNSSNTLFGTSMAAPHIAGIVALAQEYAVQLSGSRLPVNTLLSLMRSSAVTVVDGDDENDNVTNTGGSYPRVDVFALMEAILNNLGPVNPGSVSISDVSITEGDSGTQVANFTVTRSGGTAAFNVNFATANGSATAGSDYVATSGTLSFGNGVNTRTISVTINGDTAFEPNETFSVNLSGATNGATITDNSAVGTIVNNDPGPVAGSVSIADVNISEGDGGTKVATFTATRTGGTAAFGVDFATANGTAASGTDYVATSGTLSFGSGVNTQTIAVTINGDTVFEPDETFFVNLSGATNGAAIADNQSVGTIVNDDAAPPTDDYADSFTDATAPFGSIAVGGLATGNLEALADRDWFRVSLTAGATVMIDLEGAPTSSGTLIDPYVRLYNGAGQFITDNDDDGEGYNSRLIFTATSSGFHYVAAGAFADGYSGTYSVRLTSVSSDDFADSLTDATAPIGVASVGGTRTGNLEDAGDRDWFRITLNAGMTFTINLEGVDSSAGTLSDPYLRLYDGAGSLLTEDDDTGSGLNSRLSFSPTTSGTFYLAAGAFGDASAGTYALSVTAALTDDFADSFTDTASPFGLVSVGATRSGDLELVGDRDWISVVLRGGIRYTIDLEGSGSAAGSLSDPYLRLYNGAGALLAEDDDSGTGFDSRLTFTPASPGTYYLAAAAFSDTNTGTYRVRVSGPLDNDTRDGVATGDFNADGRTDLLLRNDNGRVNVWTMDGDRIVADSFVDATPLNWHIVTTADFNGDRKSDVLLRNDNGRTNVWTMDGGRIAADSFVDATPLNWHIIGTGDFNGDAKADVLLRNDNGRTNVWTMDGGRVAADLFVDATPLNWHIVDTADFNGDGKSDVLLRNDNGRTNVWTMDGGRVAADSFVDATPLNWHIVDTADFNGDGKADVLLRNDSGRTNVWTMDGGRVAADSFVDATPLNWHILGTGDFNGDGKADVLLRNDDGRTNIWIMDGGRIAADLFVDATPLSRHILAIEDFNADGKSDVLLRNDNGHTHIWTMDGGRIVVDSFVDATPLTWHLAEHRFDLV